MTMSTGEEEEIKAAPKHFINSQHTRWNSLDKANLIYEPTLFKSLGSRKRCQKNSTYEPNSNTPWLAVTPASRS